MNEEEGVDCRCDGDDETNCEVHCPCGGCERRRQSADYHAFYYPGTMDWNQ